MKKLNVVLVVCMVATASVFAQAPNEDAQNHTFASHRHGHHKHRHHHGGMHHPGDDSSHVARLTKAFFDYVKEVKEDKKTLVINALVNYTKDARTHSPTKKIRNLSKSELDAQMKQHLDNTQYSQYQDFIKDFEKMKKHRGKHPHHGNKGNRNCKK